MAVHANSQSAFYSLKNGERRAAVLAVYAKSPTALTDRQVMGALGATERNHVAPRTTELVDDGYLYEVDSVKCEVTGKTVRRCTYTGLVKPRR